MRHRMLREKKTSMKFHTGIEPQAKMPVGREPGLSSYETNNNKNNGGSGPNSPVVRHRHRHRLNLRNRFELIKTLGQGTYGKVKLAVEKATGLKYAIKTIHKTSVETEKDLQRIRREIEIMSTLNHPHIVNVYEVFENSAKIILVMEYASGGELYDFINDADGLTNAQARKFFRQIVSAVAYLHQNGIVHRDLKLENIVLDKHNNAKIADFGLSNVYRDDRFLHTFCGSPLYASPEIMTGQPYMGPEIDCWSLGVLLYTIVYGAMPFDGSDFKILKRQITTGDYFEPRESSDAAGLIRRLLTVKISQRATIEDICEHWWINYGYNTPLSEQLDAGRSVDLDGLENALNRSTTDSPQSKSWQKLGTTSDIIKRSRPVKGILKNSRSSSEGDAPSDLSLSREAVSDTSSEVWLTDADSMTDPSNCDLSMSAPSINNGHKPLQSQHSIEDNGRIVFDSSLQPKKSILKKAKSGSDSGCVIDDSTTRPLDHSEVFYSDSQTTEENNVENQKLDLAVGGEDEKCDDDDDDDKNDTYDLLDIEAVLDDCLEDDNGSSLESNLDTVVPDSHPTQGGDFRGDLCHSSQVVQDVQDFCENDLTDKTSTPSAIIRSKPRSCFSGSYATKHSIGSLGSNSSGEMLDFSYDSGDGETHLSVHQYCHIHRNCDRKTCGKSFSNLPEPFSNSPVEGEFSWADRVEINSSEVKETRTDSSFLFDETSPIHSCLHQDSEGTVTLDSTDDIFKNINNLDILLSEEESFNEPGLSLFDTKEAQEVCRKAMQICDTFG